MSDERTHFYLAPVPLLQRCDEGRFEGPSDDGMRDRLAIRFEPERGGWVVLQAQVEDGPYVEVAFIPFKVKRA